MSLRIPGIIIAATTPASPFTITPGPVYIPAGPPLSASGEKGHFGLEAVYKVTPDDCLFEGQVWGPPGFGGIHGIDQLLVRETLAQLDTSGRLVLIEAGRCAAPHDGAAYLESITEAFRLLAPRLVSLISSFEETPDATLNISLHVRGRVRSGRFRIGEASVLVSLKEKTVIALRLGLMALPGEPTIQGWSNKAVYRHLHEERPDEPAVTRALALTLTAQAFGPATDLSRS